MSGAEGRGEPEQRRHAETGNFEVETVIYGAVWRGIINIGCSTVHCDFRLVGR